MTEAATTTVRFTPVVEPTFNPLGLVQVTVAAPVAVPGVHVQPEPVYPVRLAPTGRFSVMVSGPVALEGP